MERVRPTCSQQQQLHDTTTPHLAYRSVEQREWPPHHLDLHCATRLTFD
jgi:hypothetical protein